jgi:hypothetical protein
MTISLDFQRVTIRFGRIKYYTAIIDDNGPYRRIKRQSHDPARLSKIIYPSYTVHTFGSENPDPSYLRAKFFRPGPARPNSFCSAVFLKSAEKYIFLSILDYEFEKT